MSSAGRLPEPVVKRANRSAPKLATSEVGELLSRGPRRAGGDPGQSRPPGPQPDRLATPPSDELAPPVERIRLREAKISQPGVGHRVQIAIFRHVGAHQDRPRPQVLRSVRMSLE